MLEREALGLLAESGPSSIERDLFPHLVDDGLHGHRDEGYWLDIGTPERYLQATFDILERRVETAAGAALDAAGVRLAAGATVAGSVTGPAVIEAGCRVDAGARVGPLAVLGSAVEVGEGAVVERAVVLTAPLSVPARSCAMRSSRRERGSARMPRCPARACLARVWWWPTGLS